MTTGYPVRGAGRGIKRELPIECPSRQLSIRKGLCDRDLRERIYHHPPPHTSS